MTKEPCPHLEKLLPKPERGSKRSVRMRFVGDIEKTRIRPEPARWPKMDQKDFVKRLKRFGLPAELIDVLVARFVNNLTFGEIARQGGWTSVGAAYQAYKIAVDSVKRGLKGKHGKSSTGNR